MPQIQLPDELYKAAFASAQSIGYENVDQFIAVIVADYIAPARNMDHFFTPERLTELDQILADMRGGKAHSQVEIDSEIAQLEAECRAKRVS